MRPAREHRKVKATYEGRQYDVDVQDFPVNRCTNCGASSIGVEADDAINHALRDNLQLLQPEEIRANRDALGMTQQRLADTIGFAAESLSRWENGSIIQSRSYDRMLRAYFALPSLRNFFSHLKVSSDLGRRVVGTDSRHAQIGAWLVGRHLGEAAEDLGLNWTRLFTWILHSHTERLSEHDDRSARLWGTQLEEFERINEPREWAEAMQTKSPKVRNIFSEVSSGTRQFRATR